MVHGGPAGRSVVEVDLLEHRRVHHPHERPGIGVDQPSRRAISSLTAPTARALAGFAGGEEGAVADFGTDRLAQPLAFSLGGFFATGPVRPPA